MIVLKNGDNIQITYENFNSIWNILLNKFYIRDTVIIHVVVTTFYCFKNSLSCYRYIDILEVFNGICLTEGKKTSYHWTPPKLLHQHIYTIIQINCINTIICTHQKSNSSHTVPLDKTNRSIFSRRHQKDTTYPLVWCHLLYVVVRRMLHVF